MSPLGIEILLFYYSRAGVDFDFTPCAQKELLACYLDNDMLRETHSEGREYEITERGTFYVEYLTNVPLPKVKYWVDMGKETP